MSDLRDVKKGDFVALVETDLFMPPRSIRVEVVKRNPRTLVFTHEGKEYKVDLDGTGLLSGHVEVWDEEVHARRVRERELALASRALEEFRGPRWPFARVLQQLKAEDVLDQPKEWEELRAAREAFEARAGELVGRIVESRGGKS